MTSSSFKASALPAADVIIPVYKGLDETRRCIESVLETVTPPDGIIIIEDASPEPEVMTYLREVAAREPRLRLLHNPENLGFVATVNRGMQLETTRDVVLLNSDTEVSGNWLARLKQAAHAAPDIGTATPFSNNATICSWPRFCEDNTLPPGLDRVAVDRAFAAANPELTVDIPTGVGFAMYIRRDCLAAVGLFDEESFGKGYGEENDFCRRALKAGWRNVLLGDTFVYHAGAVSFGVNTERLDAATRALLALHPDYLRVVHAHIDADPAQPLRWRAALQAMRQSPLPVILMILHGRGGGTRSHVEELVRALEGHAWAMVLMPGQGNLVNLVLPPSLGGEELPFHEEKEADGLFELLRHAGVERVHFHHFLDIPRMARDLPQKLGVPFDFTAHDFYTGCPRITLSGTNEAYCGQPADVAACNACLDRPPQARTRDIQVWRTDMVRALQQADRLITPSSDAARRLNAMLPELAFRPIPHPDAAALAIAPAPSFTPPTPGQPLKVLVLGALTRFKGADEIEAAAREAARRKLPIEFHLLGYAYRPLHRAKGRLICHGAYASEELPQRLSAIEPHVAWLPARCPETYSYTLSEVMAAGLPVVISNLGALPERIAQRPLSWILPWDASATEAIQLFDRLRRGEMPARSSTSTVAATAPRLDDFYPAGYLGALPSGDHARAPAPISDHLAETLERVHVRRGRHLSRSGMLSARHRVWRMLIGLFSQPVFRPLVQHIPISVQDRVKRLIKG